MLDCRYFVVPDYNFVNSLLKRLLKGWNVFFGKINEFFGKKRSFRLNRPNDE